MKSLYYRTQNVSNRALVWIAAVTFLALAMLRSWPVRTSERDKQRMLEAAYRAEAAFDAIACRRADLGHTMLRAQDPNETGMLGPSMSLVTTLPGHLDAKLTSINPNFAAVAVRLLLDVGAGPGDCVAIGMTGSFPALNIAVLQACESLQLNPLVVSSAASSQFGANDPGMMWPDMERVLFEEGLIGQRSLLTSLGGFRDSAAGMTDDTKQLLLDAIDRNQATLLRCETLQESVEQRMGAITRAAGDRPIVAYVNVGGGAASVGGTEGNDLWGSGLIWPSILKSKTNQPDCVATRFLKRDVPLINVVHSVAMARRYQLVIAGATAPQIGQSAVYQSASYRRWLALVGIVMVLAATRLAVKPPLFFTRLLYRNASWRKKNEQPQWMV